MTRDGGAAFAAPAAAGGGTAGPGKTGHGVTGQARGSRPGARRRAPPVRATTLTGAISPVAAAGARIAGEPTRAGHVTLWAAGAGLLLQHTVDGLRGPVQAVLVRTMLGPLTLPPAVTQAWVLSRDIGWGLLTATLLYAVLQAQFGRAIGLDVPTPWAVLPRLAVAALGVTASLPLVRALLAASNVLTATVVGALPAGAGGLLQPLTAGMAIGLISAVLDIGAVVVSLVLLAGVAALACLYVLRAAEVVLIALLLPIAAALWVVPSAAGVWRALMGELLISIFVQPVQAFVLLVFAAGLTPGAVSGGAWLWGMAALVLLFRVRGLLAAAVGQAGRWSGPLPVAAVQTAATTSTTWAGRLSGLVTRLPGL